MASIPAAFDGLARTLCATWDGRIFLEAGDGQPSFELVEPDVDASPVTAFLRRGGGLHHLCYEVDSLEAEIERARAARMTLVRPPQPAVAFDGRRICWMFSAQRLLIEYLERARPIPAAAAAP